jgi:hypothetical protein
VGLQHFDPLAPSNRLVQALKTDPTLRRRLRDEPDSVAREFALTDTERTAIHRRDFGALHLAGLHPYLLAQLARILIDETEQAGASAAARALVESLRSAGVE